jgi:hypothetical protein
MAWWSELICDHYPPVGVFDSDRKITNSELRRFARIILTEGIPFAFSRYPMAFEFARERAASSINVDPKQISITGSARLGYSLSPRKFGQAYDPAASDVDLFLIDQEKFSALAAEYAEFIALFERGKLKPRNENEQKYWPETKQFCPASIRRGFIDQKYVPAFDELPMSQNLGEANFLFWVNVNGVMRKKAVRRSSLRAYRDWNAAVDQIALSLKRTLAGRATPRPAVS